MNSGSNLKSHPVKNQQAIRQVCDKYDELFASAAKVFQKIIYAESPSAEFWEVSGAATFHRVLEQAVVAAKRHGAMVVDGTAFWSRIAPYRHGTPTGVFYLSGSPSSRSSWSLASLQCPTGYGGSR
eukprot:11170959-Lingulodinium_polyedra.AAC.1